MKKRINGHRHKSKFSAPIADVRASIAFARPVRDARGIMVDELFEDEATWKLTARQVSVQIGPTPSPLEIGARQSMPQTLVDIVPVWEILQIVDAHAVSFLVPAELAHVRQPCSVVTEKNPVDGAERRSVVPYRELVRRQAAEEAAKAEPAS